MNLTTRLVKESENPEYRWNQVINVSPEAWIFHFYELHQFRKACAKAKNYKCEDLSFFVYDDKRLVGLVPAVQTWKIEDNKEVSHLSYHDTPLPWPCFMPDVNNEVREFAFGEMESIASIHNASSIVIMLSHYDETIDFNKSFVSLTYPRKYFDTSRHCHLVKIVPDLLSKIRRRYVNYIKTCSTSYSVDILEGELISDSLIEQYSQLHAKDAGFAPRPVETYYAQAVSARKGHGFWVIAREKASDKIAGILQVLYFKAAAYPDSVGVDPDFEKEGISYLLHWNAIREAMLRGCCTYDLGYSAEGATFTNLITSKYRGISFFKDGWSQGKRKELSIFRKFLDPNYIEPFFNDIAKNISAYIGEP